MTSNPVVIGRVIWPGPVGVGAGLVKNGVTLKMYSELASSVEIGSITRHLREGNAGQTVWKYLPEQSLRHNAGMPNYGAEHLAEDLAKVQEEIKVPWGINVAVTPGITDPQEAALDIRETIHLLLMAGLSPDWITLNISSPDTTDSIELLSSPLRLEKLSYSIKVEAANFDNPPIWLKLSPKLSNTDLDEIVKISIKNKLDALIMGNTYPDQNGGGWCGSILKSHTNSAIRYLSRQLNGEIPIVGCGGVLDVKDLRHKLAVGAAAVQMVSGILMKGRDICKKIESEFAYESH